MADQRSSHEINGKTLAKNLLQRNPLLFFSLLFFACELSKDSNILSGGNGIEFAIHVIVRLGQCNDD